MGELPSQYPINHGKYSLIIFVLLLIEMHNKLTNSSYSLFRITPKYLFNLGEKTFKSLRENNLAQQ